MRWQTIFVIAILTGIALLWFGSDTVGTFTLKFPHISWRLTMVTCVLSVFAAISAMLLVYWY